MQGAPLVTILLGLSTFVQVQVESKHLLVETKDREDYNTDNGDIAGEEAGHDYADSSSAESPWYGQAHRIKSEKEANEYFENKRNGVDGGGDYIINGITFILLIL